MKKPYKKRSYEIVIKNCGICGKEMRLTQSRLYRRHCSRKCNEERMKSLTGDKAPFWGKKFTPEQHLKLKERNRKLWANGHWRGGRTRADGYNYINFNALSLEERVLFSSMNGKGGYIPEHRLAMARSIGRPISKLETVHHINGVKTDNRPENLCIHSSEDHKKEHVKVVRELMAAKKENEELKKQIVRLSVRSRKVNYPAESNDLVQRITDRWFQ